MRLDGSADEDKKEMKKAHNENVLYTMVPSFKGNDVILIIFGGEIQNTIILFKNL